MSFFSTPLSGLTASNTALEAISNNLANMNTDGYKTQNAIFSDVFYQNYGTSGNGDPIQTGLGTQVAGISQDQTEGSISSTGVSSNMALNGNGYFVTSDSSGGLSYSRAGDFTTNTAGQLTTLSGGLVMGYPATGGIVSTSSSLQPLNVGAGTTEAANPTSNFSLTTNLDASAAVNSSFSSPITLYDSLGGSHQISVNYTKTGSDSWSYNVTVPSADLQGGTGTTTTVASGTLSFDSSGNLTSPTANVALSIGPFSDGAAAMSPNWQLSASGSSLITQTASANSNSAQTQDGYASGTLSSFAVQSDGTIQATFTNGQNLAIGQVAVATFANPEGLSLSGNSQYAVTSSSGAAVIGTAGTGGRGTIEGSSVEQSNVDVATQFANLIVAQRSYEANAKAVTTFDQIEQDTIAMKSA